MICSLKQYFVVKLFNCNHKWSSYSNRYQERKWNDTIGIKVYYCVHRQVVAGNKLDLDIMSLTELILCELHFWIVEYITRWTVCMKSFCIKGDARLSFERVFIFNMTSKVHNKVEKKVATHIYTFWINLLKYTHSLTWLQIRLIFAFRKKTEHYGNIGQTSECFWISTRQLVTYTIYIKEVTGYTMWLNKTVVSFISYDVWYIHHTLFLPCQYSG